MAFAAGTTMLLASLANFLSHNLYPYFRPEVLAVALGIVVFCAPMALFYTAQRQWGRSLLEGLLIALFFDINADSLPLILLSGIGITAYTAWRRISLLGPIFAVSAVILLSTVAGVGVRTDWITQSVGDASVNRISAQADKPALLHVILDEHIGIEGLPTNDPAASLLRERLKHFYTDAGFSLYGGAYSEQLHTVNAIPYILNYGMHGPQGATTKGVMVGPTEHLNRLRALGYRVTIFQSDYADFCTGFSFAECISYDSSALAPTLSVPMRFRDRLGLLTVKFLMLSQAATSAGEFWNLVAGKLRQAGLPIHQYYIVERARSSTVGTLEAFASLEKLVRRAKPGDAFFVHLLMPHDPYVVGRNCAYLTREMWRARHSMVSGREKWRAYYLQVECVTAKVARLINALNSSDVGTNSIIIIHGDHGSRIFRIEPNAPNFGSFSTNDAIAGFSTLFAVKVPGATGSYTSIPQPASELLKQFAFAGFTSPPSTEHALKPLQLDDQDWQIRQPMDLPRDWIARLARPNVVRKQTGQMQAGIGRSM